MKGFPQLLSLLGIAAAAAFGLASCGGDEVSCGDGTIRQGDTCVPEATCGTGTTLQDGECVPDGSVICEQGTRFDMATGTCVVDPSACADGTVLVGGECVPEDDTLTADHDEEAEPNDETGAGEFDVPALNEDVTIHGCITPRAGVADSDPWIMNASGPTLVEITADGVGGLAAGFLVQDLGIAGLETYVRFGINLTGDTSKRQVYLPKAGSYVLVMDDSRALMFGEAAGGADTCYYGTIKTVAMPAATPATLPSTTGEDSGNVRVFSYTPGQVGDIFDITQFTASGSMLPAFVLLKNGQFYAHAAYDQENDFPPFYTVGGVDATDTISIISDAIYNLSISPQAYSFDMFDVAAQPLPTDGTPLTVTKNNGTVPEAPYWEANYLYFDVATAGQIVHFNVTSSVAVQMRVLRRDIWSPAGAYLSMATIATTTPATTFNNQYIRFLQPGRYYLQTFHPSGTSGQTYTVTSTLVATTPAALTYGTAATAQVLPAQGNGFHFLDLPVSVWIQAAVPAAADWGGQARVRLYDAAGEGWLDNTYNAVQSVNLPTDGSAFAERITRSDNRDWIVRVNPTTAPGASPTYSLEVKERPHAIIGEATPAAALTRTGMDDLAAGASKGFIIDGTAGHQVTSVVTPSDAGVDISVTRRNPDGSVVGSAINAGGNGAAETVVSTIPAMSSFQAFVVNNTSATTATNLGFNITAAAPRMYTVTTGTLGFNDVCATGTQIMTGQDDTLSAALTLPAEFSAFPLLGIPVGGSVKVSSNGFITFDTTHTSASSGNVAIPTAAAPGALIAAYWADLTNVRICRLDDAGTNTVTFQWTGNMYNVAAETAQFQAVLHSNGVIDLIYGPDHLMTGNEIENLGSNGATVGVENQSGTFGQQILFNMAGILPSTSRTLTPM